MQLKYLKPSRCTFCHSTLSFSTNQPNKYLKPQPHKHHKHVTTMPTPSSKWFKFKAVRRKFSKKSPERDIITVVYSDEENANLLLDAKPTGLLLLTHQDVAAITIQSHFRGHLARRAFRALRSLVKLQAMVRGARVRKQARTALHCMHAMLRLHLTVRSRQILA